MNYDSRSHGHHHRPYRGGGGGGGNNNNGGYYGRDSHNRRDGYINYDRLRYNSYKSRRNRDFMNQFESEFN